MSQEKTLHVINDIVATTKIFSGDVYGSVVRDIRISGKTEVNDIDIRIDYCYIKPYLTILNTRYTVEPVLPFKTYNGINIYSYKVSHRQSDLPFSPIVIDIVLMNPKMFKMAFIDFDVNLFAENDTCLYLRTIPYPLKYCVDKVSLIKQRISSKTFSIVDTFGPQKNFQDIVSVVNKAVEMTLLGNWTMDDFYSKPTWIVGRWDNIVIGKHKRKHTKEMYHQMISQNECCLCHDRFKPKDLVLNTACNHNFHWMCNLNTGLKVWIEQSKTCCPVCRSNMFSGSQEEIDLS